ncbi:MAG TPA: hypothetical protein VEG25_07385 [Burkholderiales bacterium]|nr:hypothetical protein [Burkholderiales bacterium]
MSKRQTSHLQTGTSKNNAKVPFSANQELMIWNGKLLCAGIDAGVA